MFSSIVGCGVLRELTCANNACTAGLFQMPFLIMEGEERAAPNLLPAPACSSRQLQNHARNVRRFSATQIDARYESLQTWLATYLCPPGEAKWSRISPLNGPTPRCLVTVALRPDD